AGVEDNPSVRRRLFEFLTADVAPGLLAHGKLDEVEELLEMGLRDLKDGDEQPVRNYAAFLLLTGRLDARLPAWVKKARKLTGHQDAEVLAHLYRAKGDLKNALQAADKTGKKWLVAALRIERADWKELAAHPDPPSENTDPLAALGYKAAYHRLA